MRDETGDTELARDTVAASEVSEGTSSTARIRPSRPVLQQGGADYAELVVVDPAHYVVTREIARGGMGRIMVARDRRLGREVALKEVLVARGGLARRFEREARITARLQHPSIVGLLEAGVWPSGDPFYAMRLVSGSSLDEAITAAKGFEGRLALLPNVLAVADAMAYAHGQRVIHRDLKPRNIVVGEFGETVVIDWGLAKELGGASLDSEPGASEASASQSGSSAAGETTAGDVLGTPSYMAPEQAAGAAVDERADVYAIGAILYHVLAGEPAFVAASNAEIIAALTQGPPPPIRARAPSAPDELIAIVERAMMRDPAKRYPTARELAEDLRRFQTGQLVGAHRYSLRQLLRRWLRRHRTALVALAAATAVGAAIGLYALSRIVAAHEDVERQRAIAVDNQRRAEDLTSFMLVDLRKKLTEVGRLDVLEDVARRAAAYYDDRGESGVAEDLHIAATARLNIGDVLHKRGDLQGARAQFDKSEAVLAKLVAAHPDNVRYAIDLAAARYHIVELQTAQGDLPGALARSRAVLADIQRVLATHPGDVDLIHKAYLGYGYVAGVLEQQGEVDAALAEFQHAFDLAAPGANSSSNILLQKDLLNAHAYVADLLRESKHDLEGALVHYRASLAIGERNAAADPTSTRWLHDVALSHKEVGAVLEEQGDHAGALAELQAGLAVAERLTKTDPTNGWWKTALAELHEHIGIVLADERDFAGALARYRLAHDLRHDAVVTDPTNLSAQRSESDVLARIGDVQLQTGDTAAALASYRAVFETRDKLAAADASDADARHAVVDNRRKLAAAFGKAGRAPDALGELRAALEVAEDIAAKHATNRQFQRDVVDTHVDLGDALAAMHDLPGARAEYRIAIGLARPRAADPQWRELADAIAAKATAAGERARE